MASKLMDQNMLPSPQLLLVGEKDRKRLLEVYVKRSLSLNDGSQCTWRKEHRSRKWVPILEQNPRDRRHSSDSSLNFIKQLSVSDPDVRFEPTNLPKLDKKEAQPEKKFKKAKVKASLRRNDGSNASQKANSKSKKWFQRVEKEASSQSSDAPAIQTPTINAEDISANSMDNTEMSTTEKKDKESKKGKKPTMLKSFLSWFSKGNVEKEQESQRSDKEPPVSKPLSPQISCLPLLESKPKSGVNVRRSKSFKKKLSHKKSFKWMQGKDASTGKSVEMVEPTSSYYEKMSEELEKIVHEVKDTPPEDKTSHPPANQTCPEVISQEEVIKRITELMKQEGDIIDNRLKENSAVCLFLESSFSYRSFQQMADQYVQLEVPSKKTRTPVVAPELVKFAFTLDFTARVANLHRQATGQIMGFGNQYLQDRFTHMSESHPHLADVKMQNSEQEFNSL
ncbi:hypothetical protein DNTS_003397 [Danionella cerebrum]|uniref:Apoptosis facilitator Bcl-2-like protein 14 n=1 Tax=Danionella cerebrum TaxID=2873325 RepID=A0A553PR38_9TELE|nr:hypothetical protein DNTS_003397 [Danionella translucida]